MRKLNWRVSDCLACVRACVCSKVNTSLVWMCVRHIYEYCLHAYIQNEVGMPVNSNSANSSGSRSKRENSNKYEKERFCVVAFACTRHSHCSLLLSVPSSFRTPKKCTERSSQGNGASERWQTHKMHNVRMPIRHNERKQEGKIHC